MYDILHLKINVGRTQTKETKNNELITMHKALHSTDNIDRLHVTRKEGRRGL